jgi:hypothetical protein
MNPRPVTAQRLRKAGDSAAVITIAMIFLVMPPAILASVGAGQIFGIPATVIYTFGVWLGVIALTAWNNRFLGATEVIETEAIAPEDFPP